MKTSVSIIFSKNKKIGSWIIRLFTTRITPIPFENIPSHVALLINNRWVFESTITSGIRVISIEKWLEQNELIYTSSCQEQAYSELKNKLKPLKNKKYDILGLIYFGYRLFLYQVFGIQIPNKNLAHITKKYFCSEVIGVLKNEDYSMKAPVQIMWELNG
jgi:hypothetical protein